MTRVTISSCHASLLFRMTALNSTYPMNLIPQGATAFSAKQVSQQSDTSTSSRGGASEATAESESYNPVELSPEEDLQLVGQTLNGDLEAFTPLILKYQIKVRNLARRFSSSEGDLEDISQEVFLRAFKKLRTFRHEAPFEHWLMRLATRVCFDFIRKRKARPDAHFVEDATMERLLHQESNQRSDQEAVEEIEAAKALVNELLAQLNPEARMVLTLQELEGKSVKEISSLTGWSTSLVKVRAFRARTQLKKLLKQTMLERFY